MSRANRRVENSDIRVLLREMKESFKKNLGELKDEVRDMKDEVRDLNAEVREDNIRRKSESETSPAIPPPQEQQPLSPNPVKSELVCGVPPPPPQVTMEDIVNSNGTVSDKFIDETEEPLYFKYLNSEAYIEKSRRYESDFRKFLVDMYFSGGDIYEEMLEVENEVVMTSRWPCTRLYADREVSYIDPVQYLAGEYGQVQEDEEEEIEEEEVKESVESATAEITPGEISNGGGIVLD